VKSACRSEKDFITEDTEKAESAKRKRKDNAEDAEVRRENSEQEWLRKPRAA
jgi:hypothetical protein